MKVLIAEDDRISRLMLQEMLAGWGYEVTAVGDGAEAWEVLQSDARLKLVILDWGLPGADGVEVCRRLRSRPSPTPAYVILLTARDAQADVVAGLGAGANDYVTKPYDYDELRARVRVGRTVVELQSVLADRIGELEAALAQVRQLRGLLPICSYCKKIRDGHDYWEQVEQYVARHTDATFSHGICPACVRDVVEPELKAAGIKSPFRPS
jgi:CheY-like chemotaxis protein